MVSFFLVLRRFIRAMVGAWRRDEEFRSLVYLVLITLAGGTIFYSTVEKWSVVDAFYFSVTTLTTVGLGDLAPTTMLGKLLPSSTSSWASGSSRGSSTAWRRRLSPEGGEEGAKARGVLPAARTPKLG
jgi:hypothetical protein